MAALGYRRAEDRLPEHAEAPGGELDPAALLGDWFATDHRATGIVKLELTRRDGVLYVRAFGANGAKPYDLARSYDWGEIEATLYGSAVTGTDAVACSAVYDFGFLVSILVAHLERGVLTVDTFNTFTDASGRSNYYSREFFHR